MTPRQMAGCEMAICINLSKELESPQSDKDKVIETVEWFYRVYAQNISKILVLNGYTEDQAKTATTKWAQKRVRLLLSDHNVGWKLWGCLQDENWRPIYPFDEFEVAA